MRFVLALVFLIHGIAHLAGFATLWRLTKSPELPYKTTIVAGLIDIGDLGARILGLAWLAGAVLFGVTALAVWRSTPDWRTPALAVVCYSLVLTVLGWPEARIGLALDVVLLVVLLGGGRSGWLPGAGAHDVTPDQLWGSAPARGAPFDPTTLTGLSEPVQRYLRHAIAPGTPLATVARIRMHGEIKLGGRWRPFTAEQVIHRDRGMIWAARVPMFGLGISGSDRVLDGLGAMRWRIAGVIPVMTAAGPDILRSGVGRLVGELIWLPPALLEDRVTWTAGAGDWVGYRVTVAGETVEPRLTLDPAGRVTRASFARWGNPDGGPHRYHEFGIAADQERTFQGYTIPTRLRAGWYLGTPRFESEGEFFRMTIDEVRYGGPARRSSGSAHGRMKVPS